MCLTLNQTGGYNRCGSLPKIVSACMRFITYQEQLSSILVRISYYEQSRLITAIMPQ